MYSLWDFRRMLDDRPRVGAYVRALRAEVRPDDVVLDVGCGFGVFAVLAARLGARLAYGVDPNPAVALAPQIARENGVEDRVRFWRARVEEVTLDPAPTLVVGDVRGVLPFYGSAVAAWNGALRHLAPGGRTIPRRDVMLAQPVRSDVLDRCTRSLDEVGGVSLRSLAGPLCNVVSARIEDEVVVGTPQPLFEIAYDRPLVPRWGGEARFDLPVGTLVDGFLLGFEAQVGEGAGFRSFGPGAATAYGASLLPAPERVTVRAGERVALRVSVREERAHPLLLWAVDVGGREGAWQSELLGEPIPLDVVRAASPEHRPAPDAEDDLDAILLSAFGRGRSVGEAAREAAAALGARADTAKVERRASELAQRRQARAVRRYEP